MGQADFFWEDGSWNFRCDECGFKFKSSQALKRWDGAMVDRKCWEPRNPQDFIRMIPERAIPWSRPDNNIFIMPPTPPELIVPQYFVDGTFIDSNFIG